MQLPTLIQFQVLCLIPPEGIGGPDLRDALKKQRVMGTGRAVFYEMMDRLRTANWVTAEPEVVEVDDDTYKQNRYRLSRDGALAVRRFQEVAREAANARTDLGWTMADDWRMA